MRETLATASFLASAALIACAVLQDPPGPIRTHYPDPPSGENQYPFPQKVPDCGAPVALGTCVDWLADAGPRAYSCDVDEALARQNKR